MTAAFPSASPCIAAETLSIDLPEAMSLQDRIASANALCAAVAECHPEDAKVLLAAMMESFSAGMPIPAFLDDIAAEAESWAAIGRDIELETYGRAIIRQLGVGGGIGNGNTAALKRLLVATWQHLTQADRKRFLDRLDAGGQFAGKVAP